jgi:predicted amidophosphoribosyltransferase
MKKIADIIQPALQQCIARENFDLIGTIPHSVPRKKDFLNTTLGHCQLTISPQKIFAKVFMDAPVAQKTLKSKTERTANAEQTLFLTQKNFPRKILLIDDACGSGATLAIAAEKIKKVSPHTEIHALTFVGSLKGFDVIAES